MLLLTPVALTPLTVALRNRFYEDAWNSKLVNVEWKSLVILYGSQTGTTKSFAESLAKRLESFSKNVVQSRLRIVVSSISDFGGFSQRDAKKENVSPKTETEQSHEGMVSENSLQSSTISQNGVSSIARFDDLKAFDFLIVCISTWTDGAPPPNSADFVDFLEEMVSDFRVDKNYFANLKGAGVVGFGNSEYKRFCIPAIGIYHKLKRLGAQKLLPLLKINDGENSSHLLSQWTDQLIALLTISCKKSSIQNGEQQCACKKINFEEGVSQPSTNIGLCSCSMKEEAEELSCDEDEVSSEDDVTGNPQLNGCGSGDASADVEDFVNDLQSDAIEGGHRPEMLTDKQRHQLQKEGYKIVGSHSAVKLCRWTKSQLRGRGGCYKHTFYGIESYLCMEATPSLACANKCVFCWRHHKNPVGKSWKWKTDDAEEILQGIKKQHYQMIKQLKGVAGVTESRFKEASAKIRHCALSLVGEPIMYPQIYALLKGMHRDRISTFLVTNAQFPDEMEQLPPVTQLYVSVDAGSKEALKEIDRPLFSDFWERFLKSLDVIRGIQQRTVFRLTLVKKYNMQEAILFGKLLLKGNPDLVEIKAVTYCGTSTGANDITMADIPWHDEVVEYAKAIINSSPELEARYELACEHRHSCCVLLAHKKFYYNGQWHTWINYEAFFELEQSNKPFTSLDYCAPTPDWAIYGALERGFDPKENRVHVKGKTFRELRDTASDSIGENVTLE